MGKCVDRGGQVCKSRGTREHVDRLSTGKCVDSGGWVCKNRETREHVYTAGYFRGYFNNKPASHNLSIIYRID